MRKELLFINEPNDVNLTGEESTWVVDSSASFHLTPNRECFSPYMASDHGYVKMGNDDACRIVGIGNVCLLTSTCCTMVLKDVHHKPVNRKVSRQRREMTEEQRELVERS